MLSAEESYRRFVGGDKAAFSDVIDEYRDNLIFFVNGYVSDLDTAEDIAADSFAELIVHPYRFAFKSSLKTYLFSIARNKAINYTKKHSRLVLTENYREEEKSSEYIEFENDILKSEQSERLHSVLGRLRESYRTAVHLVYFENMSYKEAALVMHKSVKQVDNYVTRGKAAIRKLLEEEGFVYEE